MKQSLSLLDVCRLPDVQVHSKTSFFKSIIYKQSQEVSKIREEIAKLSYTVKTIGVQGSEVGVISKRLPLKIKSKQQYQSLKKQFKSIKNFLPHQTFFAEALIPIKKQSEEKRIVHQNQVQSQEHEQKEELKIIPYHKNQFQSQEVFQNNGVLKNRTKSMVQMRSFKVTRKTVENIEELGKVKLQGMVRLVSNQKSYSKLLQEFGSQKNESINPLRHEQNSLYKNFKKIQENIENYHEQQQNLFVKKTFETTSKSKLYGRYVDTANYSSMKSLRKFKRYKQTVEEQEVF